METVDTQSRQPYEPPAVVYEASIEVRAGSPFGLSDPLKDLANPTN